MDTQYTILNYTEDHTKSFAHTFASDVLYGLTRPVKRLPSRYIYDAHGSELFCEIMDLPEYYLTDCEAEILTRHSGVIAEAIGNDRFNLIELGAGDGKKTRILIDHLTRNGHSFDYVPIDISESSIKDLCVQLNGDFDMLDVRGIVSEYFEGLRWLASQNYSRNIVLFLGSNIGNFDSDRADIFLANLWESLNSGDYLLIGFDLIKEIDTIVRAYSDSRGVTAAFNLNLLARINRELGGNFDLSAFRFFSTWDIYKNAVISSLISLREQTVSIEALKRTFDFYAWEPLHTEYSHKYSEANIHAIAEKNNFSLIQNFSDDKKYFIDSLWQVRK